MQLTSLPLDVVACVVDELVSSCNLVDGLYLRLVNRGSPHQMLHDAIMKLICPQDCLTARSYERTS
jgi:hypothetical protein